MSEHALIQDELSSTQKVKFVIDASAEFEQLSKVDLSQYGKAIVFCDLALKDSWWPKINQALTCKKIQHIEWLQAGEEIKSLDYHSRLVNCLTDNRCTRDDVVIAIGGGTVLDAIAYLASVYMRGISLFMIPTTLMGQADASTAGKTCINTDYAKNVLGTLYLPAIVYDNVTVLETNSPYDLRQGFSEIFKYGLLGSQHLLDLLKDYAQTPSKSCMIKILQETIRVRLCIRKRDPLASNLGHTFGHAFEKISDFAVNHGDAISAGIVLDLEFSAQEGIITEQAKEEIIGRMLSLGLNTKIATDMDLHQVIELMKTDKKSSGTDIGLVLIHEIGRLYENNGSPFYKASPEQIFNFLQKIMRDSRYVAKNHWQTLREKNYAL